MEPEAPFPEVDDVQLAAERHHALAHADQSQPLPLRCLAAVDPAASVVLDRQGEPLRPACGGLLGLPGKTESNPRPPRLACLPMFVRPSWTIR